MKVLYVGNGAYKAKGNMYYDVGRKICNGFTRFSDSNNVYFFSDRDTSRAGNFLGSSKLGNKKCNRIFLDICRNYQPDLIIICHADIIKGESLAAARSILPQVRIAQVGVDVLYTTHKMKMLTDKTPYLDALFVTTAGDGLKELSNSKCVVSYIPNPVDPSIESPKCHDHSDQKHDVFWACRMTEGHDRHDNPRFSFPMHLEKSDRVKIDYYGMNGRSPVFGAAYFKAISNARMGLNINRTKLLKQFNPSSLSKYLYLYSSDRIAHYMGSGLMILCYRDNEADNKLEELFVEDKEMVFFSSKEELLDKVLYFKEHDDERKEIASMGWEKCHQKFNERLVAKYIKEVTFREELTEDYAWPTTLY